MKIGRNAPCPCGSGKRYKKCCLQKDEEARWSAVSIDIPEIITDRTDLDVPQRPTSPVPRHPEPPDPRIQALNARWDTFEKQDYEGRIALFLKTLDEEELMDAEMAFEMLSTLYYQSLEHNERERFDKLVDGLHKRLPAVYADQAHWFLSWRITNALATGRLETIPALARDMAATAGKDIDTFNNTHDQLAYHGQLLVLVESMRIAWPLVKESTNIVPWGIDKFAGRIVNYEIFDYLERHASPIIGDPELIKQLKVYVAIDPTRLTRYMTHLTGQAQRHWTMSDFEFNHGRLTDSVFEDDDEAEQAPDAGTDNLLDLSCEFLGYLRRQEGVPYTKGELGRVQIQRYLLDRDAGELEPREGLFEAMMRPRKRQPKPKPRRSDHVLCPDRDTLDRYLVRLLDFINPQRYKTAATLELVPAWLRFLESRQLIDARQRAKTLLELRGLDVDLLKVWKNYPADPALQLAMERWREPAGKETSL